MSNAPSRLRLPFIAAVFVPVFFPALAFGQLRIVSYNTAGGPLTGLGTVLEAIGTESVNGVAKPIDVLALQEQASSSTTTRGIVDVLNGIYGEGTYARATTDGDTSGAGRPGLIYNASTVRLIDETAFGTVNTSAQARQTLRYQLRPLGYGSEADFYLFSNHYKAGTSSSDKTRRDIEATRIRSNVDSLGEGTHAIFAGDFNIRSSNEGSYQTLVGPGPCQAFDPINSSGNWHDASNFRQLHTQAPAKSGSGGLIGGGVDDRFDFQLLTGEFFDNEGLDYIGGSYHTFGNNGSHTINESIDTGNGALPATLDALMTASDHLPVVADYQLPAVMEVLLDSIPATVPFGSVVDMAFTVENIAPVIHQVGADELDYEIGLDGLGSIIGAASGSLLALAGAESHTLRLDTSTPGTIETTLFVEASEAQTGNRMIEIPLSYEVLPLMGGDFDDDGDVDGEDFLIWQLGFGVNNTGDADGDGDTDGNDFLTWQHQFESASGSGGNTAVVPEPHNVMLAFALLHSLLLLRPFRRA